MSYRFEKLWHLAINWALRKAFQCILQGVRFCWQSILEFPQHLRMTHTQLSLDWRSEWAAKANTCQQQRKIKTNKTNIKAIDLKSLLHTGHFPTLGLRSRLGTSLRSRLLQDHLHVINTKRYKTQHYTTHLPNANTKTSKPWLLLSCSGIVDRLNSTEEKLEAASNNSMVAFLPTDGLTFLSRSAPA